MSVINNSSTWNNINQLFSQGLCPICNGRVDTWTRSESQDAYIGRLPTFTATHCDKEFYLDMNAQPVVVQMRTLYPGEASRAVVEQKDEVKVAEETKQTTIVQQQQQQQQQPKKEEPTAQPSKSIPPPPTEQDKPKKSLSSK